MPMVRKAGGKPVPAEVAYALPTPCDSPDEQVKAVLVTEQRCTAVYASMVGATSQANRQWALEALVDAAVREVRSGGDAEAFPGVAEL